MSTDCIKGVNIVQVVDGCGGKTIKTDCVTYPSAITYLDLPESSTVTEIVTNLVVSLADARIRVEDLEDELSIAQADILELQGSKIINNTTVALSSLLLNTTYPTATIGFKVYALGIVAGALIYEKVNTEWVQYPVTITV